MLENDNEKKRPEIEYPCDWQYKLIGRSPEDLVEAAENAAEGFKYDITASNISKKGNYVSINLMAHVDNETERILIMEKLESNESVLFIL